VQERIEVVRNQTLVQVKLNGTEYFRKTLSTTGLLDAQVLYLGGPAPTRESLLGATTEPGLAAVPGAGVPIEDTTVPKEADDSRDYFKGIIQDVKVSNGSLNLIVEMYSLNVTDVQVNAKPLGAVTIDRASVLPGEVSDDLCRKNPCRHNAECRNTWNDYSCKCPNGYKGKDCQEIEFCQLVLHFTNFRHDCSHLWPREHHPLGCDCGDNGCGQASHSLYPRHFHVHQNPRAHWSSLLLGNRSEKGAH